ncbi:class I SAM-dependent RNA methyltransferase [Actinoalloteichus caeruleus]|uniref:class I SAM-dependent RNA methyltransferase n=1 Tax=Actinoalloteichus cyanogriseus TaxID=2893586 RepID=UPI003BB9A2DF
MSTSAPSQRPDWTGHRIDLEVGPPGHGGFCVARHEGRVVFVRHALPGERVTALVTEDKGGGYCRADAVTVHSASPDRVTPSCPLSGPGGCGGCDWQHVRPERQRAIKAGVVEEQLRRIAGVDRSVVVEELPGGVLGWRSRVRLAVDDAGVAGFRAHRSHRVVAATGCPLSVPGMVDGLLGRRWRPGIELDVTVDANEQVHVSELRPGRGSRPTSRRIAGDGVAVQRAAGRDWRVHPHGFWQVHPAAADVLAEAVGSWTRAPRGGTAWDLYGGAGLFASVLAEQVGTGGAVVVVESAPRAVADGERELADLPQVSFVTGRVERVLARGLGGGAPDVVVLDPPRKGAGREVISQIGAARPARVVHVACDPAAFARDVGLLREQGYRLAELRAFDAFPMTHHVECVALFEQADGNGDTATTTPAVSPEE